MTTTAASSPAATSICGILALASSDPTSSRKCTTSGPSGSASTSQSVMSATRLGRRSRNPTSVPVPARHVARAEPGLATVAPGRARERRHDPPRSDVARGGERREQHPLLVAKLRFGRTGAGGCIRRIGRRTGIAARPGPETVRRPPAPRPRRSSCAASRAGRRPPRQPAARRGRRWVLPPERATPRPLGSSSRIRTLPVPSAAAPVRLSIAVPRS